MVVLLLHLCFASSLLSLSPLGSCQPCHLYAHRRWATTGHTTDASGKELVLFLLSLLCCISIALTPCELLWPFQYIQNAIKTFWGIVLHWVNPKHNSRYTWIVFKFLHRLICGQGTPQSERMEKYCKVPNLAHWGDGFHCGTQALHSLREQATVEHKHCSSMPQSAG